VELRKDSLRAKGASGRREMQIRADVGETASSSVGMGPGHLLGGLP
jgi:hypothetical protein